MTPADKVRENRLRRMASRQGFKLRKSPRRDHRAIGYGRYQLVPTDQIGYDAGDMAYRLTLDEVERSLTEDQP